MEVKLILSLIILFVFTILYVFLSKSEFGISPIFKEEINEIKNEDLICFSIYNQIGTGSQKFYPLSWKAKILTLLQMIMGYAILLI